MTDRKAIQRILERLGFVHVAGWVKVQDAPAIRRKIEAARKEVEKIKGGDDEHSTGTVRRDEGTGGQA